MYMYKLVLNTYIYVYVFKYVLFIFIDDSNDKSERQIFWLDTSSKERGEVNHYKLLEWLKFWRLWGWSGWMKGAWVH